MVSFSEHTPERDEAMKRMLNLIEGYKTRLKELHWAADTTARHELIDKISDELGKYEDSISEDYQASNDFPVGSLNPQLPESMNLIELIKEIKNEVVIMMQLEDLELTGIKSESEAFYHKLRVFLYLARRSYK